jgi:hypothetical protein
MWESSIYTFEVDLSGKSGSAGKGNIVIDVTDSAPTMDDPGKYLEGVFSLILADRDPEKTKILDFGAGKMRNTLYLLKQGYQVYAAEFPELPKHKKQARVAWDKLEQYPNFRKLVFPVDFYKLREMMDVVLLINVLNVMPVPLERFAVLALCRKKIRKDGLLYLLNWRPASSNPEKYNDSTRLNDGWFCGKGREVMTFHAEWSREETFEMLAATGYSRNNEIDIEGTGGSHSYIFAANSPILIENTLHLKEIERGLPKHEPEVPMKESQRPSILKQYFDEMATVKPGIEGADKYKHLVMREFLGIFDTQLKNPRPEASIDNGRGFIDIRFQNRNAPGFFKNAKELYDIKCPTIPIECKNYSTDISVDEINQMSDRLDSPDRGMLGFIACRHIDKTQKIFERCRDKRRNRKYIIVLEDRDFQRLIRLRIREEREAIDDYMVGRINELID